VEEEVRSADNFERNSVVQMGLDNDVKPDTPNGKMAEQGSNFEDLLTTEDVLEMQYCFLD